MFRPLSLIPLFLLLLTGCSNDFVATEDDIESGGKTRPFAIICEPPEAAPGDTVSVTLHLFEPDPANMTVAWQVALDYNVNLYGDMPTEGEIVDLHDIAVIPEPVYDPDGIGEQTFRFVVPQNTMLLSSAVAERFPVAELSPAMVELFQPADPNYVTKGEIDQALTTIDPGDLDGETLAAFQVLADLFVCQVKLRAKVSSGIELDVTRNLTVRYSNKFMSPNRNRNPLVERIILLAVHHKDVEFISDIPLHTADTTLIHHRDFELVDPSPVPFNPDWTYFLQIEHDADSYLSPDGNLMVEEHEYRWYFERLGTDVINHDFYEWDDNDLVLIKPPQIQELRTYRLFTVVRDYRPEWNFYVTSPGGTFTSTVLEFSFE